MSIKIALIGQDAAMYLPSFLVDFLYVGREDGLMAVEERNAAMQEVLLRYGEAVIHGSGRNAAMIVTGSRPEVLIGADCVIYAGDCMAATRFRQDKDALSGVKEGDPGLTDQCRVTGGIEGLMRTLRQGEIILDLAKAMRTFCPKALVITLGSPVARTARIFQNAGFRTFGMDDAWFKGPNDARGLIRLLNRKAEDVDMVSAGLPGFSFLLKMKEKKSGADLLPAVKQLAEDGRLGRMTRRWLSWYEAVAVGDVVRHAELLPAQEDYIPEEEPLFGESIEKRKERIAHMNAVGTQGEKTAEGMSAQVALLKSTSPLRPVKLALALLRGEDAFFPAITRQNRGELPQLSPLAMIESPLRLTKGEARPHGLRMPEPLAAIMNDLDDTAALAAEAAAGDWSALRECVEVDPAMQGLDRLYVQEVVRRLVQLNGDVLSRLADEDDEEI